MPGISRKGPFFIAPGYLHFSSPFWGVCRSLSMESSFFPFLCPDSDSARSTTPFSRFSASKQPLLEGDRIVSLFPFLFDFPALYSIVNLLLFSQRNSWSLECPRDSSEGHLLARPFWLFSPASLLCLDTIYTLLLWNPALEAGPSSEA